MFEMAVIGKITKQGIEMRYLPNGDSMVTFTVTHSEPGKEVAQDGSKVYNRAYIRCVAYGKTGETINNFFGPGKGIYVRGDASFDPQTNGPRTWSGQDGKVHASFELKVRDWQFLPRDNGGDEGGGAVPQPQRQQQPARPAQQKPAGDDYSF